MGPLSGQVFLQLRPMGLRAPRYPIVAAARLWRLLLSGRYKNTTLLICRRDVPKGKEEDVRYVRFRKIRQTNEDQELWELFNRERHVLTACPSDTLFHAQSFAA